jgi:molybdopterin molybdotransferase
MAGSDRKVNRQAGGIHHWENFTWRTWRVDDDSTMVSFPEALNLLLKNLPPQLPERCRLESAAGRILREVVCADRPVPAFDRVMMDGYALRVEDWQNGHRKFQVMGSAPAGSPQVTLNGVAGACVEVMTGAPCPLGADGIVPVEEVIARDPRGVEFGETAAPIAGRYLHRQGSDAATGEVLLEVGTRLGSRELGVAASCGAGVLEVSRIPQIAVIATGDELVALDEVPAAHQIRQSNGHSLAAALQLAGFPPASTTVLGDEVAEARPALLALLEAHDWVVLTGAVSMGGHDFVPALLAEFECRKVFHGIAQRPGKPAGCWIGPAGQVIVALPGNPVSALTGLHSLVIPALEAASAAAPAPRRWVTMDDPAQLLRDFTRHLPVRFRADGRVEPVAVGNSGDFIGLLRSDGFITLPPREGIDVIPAAFPFTPWL